MKLSLILVLIGFSVCHSLSALADKDLLTSIPFRSELWPARITVSEAILDEKGDVLLKAKTRGVLVRVEQGRVIVDFSSNGVLPVPIGKTNLLEQAEAFLAGEERKPVQLFTSPHFNKFFHPQHPKQIQVKYQELHDVDYFILLYVDFDTRDGKFAIEALRNFEKELLSESNFKLQILTIPLDETREEMMKDLETDAINWPVMLPFLKDGYIRSLHHSPTNPTIRVIDPNGRLVTGSVPNTIAIGYKKFLQQLNGFLDSDEVFTGMFRATN